jgi:hypothetical protein
MCACDDGHGASEAAHVQGPAVEWLRHRLPRFFAMVAQTARVSQLAIRIQKRGRHPTGNVILVIDHAASVQHVGVKG